MGCQIVKGCAGQRGNLTLPKGGVILRSGVLGIFKVQGLTANGKNPSTILCTPVRLHERKLNSIQLRPSSSLAFRAILGHSSREAYHAFPNHRRISLFTRVGHRGIRANRASIFPATCAYWRRRYAEGAPAPVYGRANTLPAVPDQCSTCRRAPRLPWLPYGMQRALLRASTAAPAASRYWRITAAIKASAGGGVLSELPRLNCQIQKK